MTPHGEQTGDGLPVAWPSGCVLEFSGVPSGSAAVPRRGNPAGMFGRRADTLMTRTEEIHWKGGDKGTEYSSVSQCHWIWRRTSSDCARRGLVILRIQARPHEVLKQRHWPCSSTHVAQCFTPLTSASRARLGGRYFFLGPNLWRAADGFDGAVLVMRRRGVSSAGRQCDCTALSALDRIASGLIADVLHHKSAWRCWRAMTGGTMGCSEAASTGV